ncbi:MAG: O-antigen ligase family protein [Pirellulaceae bacterium]|jgi:O-antigen ligase|nr:O-antigen ligase family protein [Pirellulaceae bacterium]
MASIAFDKPDESLALRFPQEDRHGWGFLLLLGTVATLFLRPADLVPALEAWPVYQFLIFCCLLVAARATLRQLSHRSILEQPVLACLLLLLVAVGFSHLSHGFVWGARMSVAECCKLVALYLLIVALANTPYRLIKLVQWLAISITVVAALALLDRYELFSVAALESIHDRGAASIDSTETVERIRGTGIFQDPNDFGLILVTGLVLSASFLLRPHAGWLRHLWLVPCCILVWTIALTHSRGAMLSLVCAVPAVVAYCHSVRVGIASLVMIPIIAVVFSARMTDVNAIVEGTGQSRIQIWSESFAIWKQHPMFGLGEGLLVDELGVVTHNSFLHCFAELGFLGGAAFVSCFLAAGMGLWQLRDDNSPVKSAETACESQQLAHHRTYIFAALMAYIAGILTLSRQFVVPTYLMLGLASAAFSHYTPAAARMRVGNRFVVTALIVSGLSLVAFYITVRVFIRR